MLNHRSDLPSSFLCTTRNFFRAFFSMDFDKPIRFNLTVSFCVAGKEGNAGGEWWSTCRKTARATRGAPLSTKLRRRPPLAPRCQHAQCRCHARARVDTGRRRAKAASRGTNHTQNRRRQRAWIGGPLSCRPFLRQASHLDRVQALLGHVGLLAGRVDDDQGAAGAVDWGGGGKTGEKTKQTNGSGGRACYPAPNAVAARRAARPA